ncbi:hypothetical protein CEP51_003949 [Fusarium floridanum]|uniref:Uncharacterized protein n=1 Tax=Fusarium floridanum TaxID=1325733 RepID=A0A428S3G5_9HYPO|nr:hypothetical protein CEP51_003949 [Fusarium floridanum]
MNRDVVDAECVNVYPAAHRGSPLLTEKCRGLERDPWPLTETSIEPLQTGRWNGLFLLLNVLIAEEKLQKRAQTDALE